MQATIIKQSPYKTHTQQTIRLPYTTYPEKLSTTQLVANNTKI